MDGATAVSSFFEDREKWRAPESDISEIVPAPTICRTHTISTERSGKRCIEAHQYIDHIAIGIYVRLSNKWPY